MKKRLFLILIPVLLIGAGVWGCSKKPKGQLCSGSIITVAGKGSEGFSGDGGPATLAELNYPCDVVLDSSSNLYVFDQGNDRFRKVDFHGIISTVAGNGEKGYRGDGGKAISAEFSDPTGFALDRFGNIFIADTGNDRIRKVTLNDSNITTVAGGGLSNSYTGLAKKAFLGMPNGIALDSKGNLFIADNAFMGVLKVDTKGYMTRIAGNGKPTNAISTPVSGPATLVALINPSDVAIDSQDNLYILDGEARILKVDTGGSISTVASTDLNFPTSLTLDASGNIYLACPKANRILKVDTNGNMTTVAGTGTSGYSGDGGSASSTKLSQPNGVAVDASGNIFIADSGNNRILEILH